MDQKALERLGIRIAHEALLDTLAWIILCKQAIPNPVELMKWELKYRLDETKQEYPDQPWAEQIIRMCEQTFGYSKLILCSAERKKELKKRVAEKENLRGVLLYYWSHFIDSTLAIDHPPDATCHFCGERYNSERNATVVDQIKHGLRLNAFSSPYHLKDVFGTHLSFKEINKMVGKKINPANQAKYLEETLDRIDFSELCRQLAREILKR